MTNRNNYSWFRLLIAFFLIVAVALASLAVLMDLLNLWDSKSLLQPQEAANFGPGTTQLPQVSTPLLIQQAREQPGPRILPITQQAPAGQGLKIVGGQLVEFAPV